MNEIASNGQLRMSLLRWVLVCVPALCGVGTMIALASRSAYSDRWYDALNPAAFMPSPGIIILGWTIAYALAGLALAVVLGARGARGRTNAAALCLIMAVASFAWAPLFFGAHNASAALILAMLLSLLGAATAWMFARIRPLAGGLMLLCLGWLGLVAVFNYQINSRNHDAQSLDPPVVRTNIGDGQGD